MPTKIRTMMEKILEVHPFLKELRNQRDMRKAIIIPTIGAINIKAAVLRMIGELTALKPPAATAAPANPPIKVWEEEEGMPSHQVSKFQAIAAINPEKITTIILVPTKSGFTVLATVSATPWSLKMKKATELNNAAQSTA